jgi:hypothetical protein
MTSEWVRSQQNLITFVLIDSNSTEVAGLGTAFVLEVAKAGGSFVGSAGTKAEMANGWYSYLSTTAEADTLGPVSIKVTHASVVQQNLEYTVKQRTIAAVEVTYTVLDTGSNPIDGVAVWATTDVGGTNVIWYGTTDALGVARDSNTDKPFLDAGTYYFWSQKAGYTFPNPDTEIVT